MIAAALLPQFFFLGGCESFRDLGLEGRPRSYIKSPPVIMEAEELPEGSALYVTCFEYPPGYDYIRDTLHGVGSQVVLYRDGEKVFSAPADGLSPDECRVVAGRLYMPLRQGGCTEVRREEDILFRYEGEELLESIVVDGESVVTLGRRLSGGGFCCRIDGREVFSSQKGVPVAPVDGGGALRLDDDGYIFFYTLPLVGVSGKKSLCYVVRNWEESQIGLPDDIAGVFDAVSVDGTIYVAGETSSGGCSIFHEGTRANIASTSARIFGIRFFSVGDQMYVTGYYKSATKQHRMVWDVSAKVKYRLDLYDSNWIYPAESGYYCVERKGADVQCYFGTNVLFRTYGRLWSSRCAGYWGRTMYMSVTDEGGEYSTVYSSDGSVVMTVKGVITEVCYSALILPDEDSG